MPLISDIITRPGLSGPCSAGLFKTFVGLQQQKAWAIRMALANGLIPSNMLDGAFVNFGGYEQCLQTRVRSSDGELYFKGQYCSIFLKPPPGALESLTARFQEIGELTGRFDPTKRRNAEHFMNTDYRGSICMPSLCTTEDLNFLARSVLGIYGANATVADCRTDDPKPLTRLQAAAM
ncbi:uncharacterized protein ISCGN_014737 [Ixodes scapularis]